MKFLTSHPIKTEVHKVKCAIFDDTHLIYQPRQTSYQIGTFADDRAIFESHEHNTTSCHLQDYLNLIQDWISKWEIKIIEIKSTHTRFFFKPFA